MSYAHRSRNYRYASGCWPAKKPKSLMCVCGVTFVTRHTYNEHVKVCPSVRIESDLAKARKRADPK